MHLCTFICELNKNNDDRNQFAVNHVNIYLSIIMHLLILYIYSIHDHDLTPDIMSADTEGKIYDTCIAVFQTVDHSDGQNFGFTRLTS